MRNIIKELYRGNINPTDKQFHRGTQYDDALKYMCTNENKLESMLEGKELEIFEKYRDHKEELEQYNEEDAFVTGFRLGARLVIESFCEDDGFFSEIDA